jgi:hypothetical protein
MNPGFLAPLLKKSDPPLSLLNSRTGGLVADRVETAFDSDSRRRGLMGREGLPAGTALVIAPSNSVHTFHMRFAIDVVFAGRDGRVLKVRRALRPWRVTGAWGAFAVIELAADSPGLDGLLVGDRLEVASANPLNSGL